MEHSKTAIYKVNVGDVITIDVEVVETRQTPRPAYYCKIHNGDPNGYHFWVYDDCKNIVKVTKGIALGDEVRVLYYGDKRVAHVKGIDGDAYWVKFLDGTRGAYNRKDLERVS